MLTLQKASRIYSEFNNIMDSGDSSYLSEAIVHKTGKICDFMNNLNADSILYSQSHLSAKTFIKNLTIDNIEVIGYKNKADKNPYYGKQFYVDVEKICELSQPALFGKGNETVYDENVRKAFDITADRIKINEKHSIKEFNHCFKDIIPQNKKFRYELYKMHVYKEGGKFTRHKDTIHAPNHYATLVVYVPSDFKGGELLLYENKGDETPLVSCKFRDYYYNSSSVIFLTDVEHEVLEVESGTRIVLQYDIYLENDEDKKDENDDDDDEYDCECPYNKPSKLYLSKKEYLENLNNITPKMLLEEVDNFVELHSQDEICFLLSREYPLSVTKDYLKAGDKTLYDILSSKYLIEIGYVVNHFLSDYEGSYDYEERAKLKVMNYTNVTKFIQKFNENEVSDNEDENKVEERKEIGNTHVFVAGGKFKTMKSIDYCEHTGNEAAPAEYTYVSVVLCCKKKE